MPTTFDAGEERESVGTFCAFFIIVQMKPVRTETGILKSSNISNRVGPLKIEAVGLPETGNYFSRPNSSAVWLSYATKVKLAQVEQLANRWHGRTNMAIGVSQCRSFSILLHIILSKQNQVVCRN